jgi:hypothetical protein
VRGFFNEPGGLVLQVDHVANGAALKDLSPTVQSSLYATASIVHSIYHLDCEATPGTKVADSMLRGELADVLERGAEDAPAGLRDQMKARAAAVRDRSYDKAAEITVRAVGPWKLILSEPVSHWTKRKAMTFILFKQDASIQISPEIENSVANLAHEDGAFSSEWASRPGISLGHRVLSAGGSSAFPQDFANFMPEDEDVQGNNLTLFYVNYYLDRIEKVSSPNLVLHSRGGINPIVNHVTKRLSVDWFRAHDIAHSCYDHHVIGISDLPRNHVHGLRELFADLAGLNAIQTVHPTDIVEYYPTYLAELLRYAARDDGQRSADGLSARLQLSALLTQSDGADVWTRLEAMTHAERMFGALMDMRTHLISLVMRQNSVQIERYIEKQLSQFELLVGSDLFARPIVIDDLFIDFGLVDKRSRSAHHERIRRCARI